MDGKHVEPVEQILAEGALSHARAQVAVGRGDDAHIDMARAHLSDPFEAVLLQYTQQLDLHDRRQFAHFIQEERAPLGAFESAGVITHGAGERAFRVAEQFAFEQRG